MLASSMAALVKYAEATGFIHFVGVAGTQRLGMFTCLADVLVQARVMVLKLIGEMLACAPGGARG